MTDINKEINRLKKEKRALILSHYYQSSDIQDVSDFVGDSFALSKIAKEHPGELIVFCGVEFMGETAKILSPRKKVLMATSGAGCFLADTVTEKSLSEYKKDHPQAKIIAYVNTSAKVKALADVCVTSSNAIKIIKHFSATYPESELLYLPDKNLASYVSDKYNIPLSTWHGYCDVHQGLTEDDCLMKKSEYPNAPLLIHPEAPLEVLKQANFVGSTQGIINQVGLLEEKGYNQFIIGTERGILHPLMQKYPNSEFILLSKCLCCQSMKMTTLDELYQTLLTERNEIILDDETIRKAQSSLELMLKLGSE